MKNRQGNGPVVPAAVSNACGQPRRRRQLDPIIETPLKRVHNRIVISIVYKNVSLTLIQNTQSGIIGETFIIINARYNKPKIK